MLLQSPMDTSTVKITTTLNATLIHDASGKAARRTHQVPHNPNSATDHKHPERRCAGEGVGSLTSHRDGPLTAGCP